MTHERWQQITGMFHAALQRTSGQRGTFLADACGTDEALRAEVEAMLAAHDSAGDPGSIPAVAVSEQMLRLESGSAVGRYRIDGKIAERRCVRRDDSDANGMTMDHSHRKQ